VTVNDARLRKIHQGLTARERALAALEAYKADRKPDPTILSTTPSEQVAAYNTFIARLERLDTMGRSLLFAMDRAIGEVEALASEITALRLIDLRLEPVWTYLWLGAGEPITASDYARLLAKARSQRLTVDDGAEVLADRDEEAEETDTKAPQTDWEQQLVVKRRVIEEAVASGELKVGNKAGKHSITAGDLYDWLGDATPVSPKRGLRYDIHPDSETDEVGRLRALRDDAWNALEHLDTISAPDTEHPVGSGASPGETTFSAFLGQKVRNGVAHQWQELRAIEQVVETVAGELDCADPLLPTVGALLQRCRGRLEAVAHQSFGLVAPIELPEPDDECRMAVAGLFASD